MEQLNDHNGPLLSDSSWYHQLVGHLLYLTIIIADVIYSVNILCQLMSQPRESHWQVALRIVRYIKISQHLTLFSYSFQVRCILWLWLGYLSNNL